MNSSMNQQEQLYGLMALAQEQQKTAAATLERLAAERSAWAAERAAFAKERQALSELVTESYRMSATLGEVTEKAARSAIGSTVRDGLAGIGASAAQALLEATTPVVDRLSGAERMVRRLERAAGMLGGILAVIVLSGAWLLWRLHDLRTTATALSAQIATERATVAYLDRHGGRLRWKTCGPQDRLCFEAASTQGRDTNGAERTLNARNWSGAWTTVRTRTHGNIPLVIPRGY